MIPTRDSVTGAVLWLIRNNGYKVEIEAADACFSLDAVEQKTGERIALENTDLYSGPASLPRRSGLSWKTRTRASEDGRPDLSRLAQL